MDWLVNKTIRTFNFFWENFYLFLFLYGVYKITFGENLADTPLEVTETRVVGWIIVMASAILLRMENKTCQNEQ